MNHTTGLYVNINGKYAFSNHNVKQSHNLTISTMERISSLTYDSAYTVNFIYRVDNKSMIVIRRVNPTPAPQATR